MHYKVLWWWWKSGADCCRPDAYSVVKPCQSTEGISKCRCQPRKVTHQICCLDPPTDSWRKRCGTLYLSLWGLYPYNELIWMYLLADTFTVSSDSAAETRCCTNTIENTLCHSNHSHDTVNTTIYTQTAILLVTVDRPAVHLILMATASAITNTSI